MRRVVLETRGPGQEPFSPVDRRDTEADADGIHELAHDLLECAAVDECARVLVDDVVYLFRNPTLEPGGLLMHPMPDHTGFVPLCFVPAGDFTRGCDTSEWKDERPDARVTISRGFFLAKYPTTVGEFARFVTATKYVTTRERAKSSRTWRSPGFAQTDRHPVVCVSHDDALAYAAWAGLTLPTETQWEYAARGTDGRTYPWGNDEPTGDRLQWRASGTCPVGEHPAGASPFGVHGLAGNVWEWCADWYADQYDPSQTTDPTGPTTGTARVLRGGSWLDFSSDYVRAAFRHCLSPSFVWVVGGFRCAGGVK